MQRSAAQRKAKFSYELAEIRLVVALFLVVIVVHGWRRSSGRRWRW
jgi:hypothetical protein